MAQSLRQISRINRLRMTSSKAVSNSFVVRAGSPAVLLLDSDHVHIRLSVICLENGSTGQKIRVESKDPRQTYVAEVIDGGILRGSL